MLYKVVPGYESPEKGLKRRDHSNESNLAVLSCDAVYYTVVVRLERMHEILNMLNNGPLKRR